MERVEECLVSSICKVTLQKKENKLQIFLSVLFLSCCSEHALFYLSFLCGLNHLFLIAKLIFFSAKGSFCLVLLMA